MTTTKTQTAEAKAMKLFARLLGQALREEEKARAGYKRSGNALDEAIKLGVPFGTTIEIPERKRKGVVVAPARKVIVKDNFDTEKSALYRPARLPRFEIEEVNENPTPRARRKQAQPQPAPTAEAGV